MHVFPPPREHCEQTSKLFFKKTKLFPIFLPNICIELFQMHFWPSYLLIKCLLWLIKQHSVKNGRQRHLGIHFSICNLLGSRSYSESQYISPSPYCARNVKITAITQAAATIPFPYSHNSPTFLGKIYQIELSFKCSFSSLLITLL